jgi:hypothetical protein
VTFRKTALASVALAAMSFAAPMALADYIPSHDGKDRSIDIENASRYPVISIVATALDRPTRISGDRISTTTISAGQVMRVIFDDGNGACMYRITANGPDRVRWTKTMDVCSQSSWRLGN